MSYSEGCIICGKELVYTQAPDLKRCYYCGNEIQSNVNCPDGHYICDSCHASSAFDLIEVYCSQSDSTNAIDMAVHLMKSNKISMHGPEHHYLVPAVLLAAFINLNKDGNYNKSGALRVAKLRAEKVLGGFCGTHGSCGAAIGTGIFMSIITGSTPLAEKEWQLSNTLTAKSLLAIAEKGGPRCCKRDSFIAISEALVFLRERFDTDLPAGEIQCEFSHRNKQCKFEYCNYFKGYK